MVKKETHFFLWWAVRVSFVVMVVGFALMILLSSYEPLSSLFFLLSFFASPFCFIVSTVALARQHHEGMTITAFIFSFLFILFYYTLFLMVMIPSFIEGVAEAALSPLASLL